TILIKSLKTPSQPGARAIRQLPPAKTLGRVAIGVVSLVGYRYLLPVLGFAPDSFLFVFLLTRALGRHGWVTTSLFSAATAAACYLVFQIFLKIPMPKGIFGI
ncbi:MAG TPA: tripartite tricarboxylate transporter TctB family protein, partial [Thermodesulfobacteriota bacterium]|nr:tripartite tricarboxylate transporter TctB family protein [Thermodesulfobacteriota bacterium]